MRLKENRDNWKATNVIRKIAQPPSEVKPRSHKDTRRWCKGKVGREHDVYLIDFSVGFFDEDYATVLFKCASCGKEFYQGMRK